MRVSTFKKPAMDAVAGNEDWFVPQAGGDSGAGQPSWTIGFENRFNPALTLVNEASERGLIASLPLRPVEMTRIVAAHVAA